MFRKTFTLSVLFFLCIGFAFCSGDNVKLEDVQKDPSTEDPTGGDKEEDKGTIDEDLVTENGVRVKAFAMLNLDRAGLEQVKLAVDAKDYDLAAERLLEYYRQAKAFVHPSFDINNVTVSDQDQLWADNGMQHIFQSVKGFDPLCYDRLNEETGEKEIDWTYWPKKDNEIRWQLHRMYWWVPMGKVYYTTKNEAYAKEWVFQYQDWAKKNPMPTEEMVNVGARPNKDNYDFTWRPLEVSHRIEDQIIQFQLFLNAESFTAAFLTEFLINYANHANYILKNYTPEGNHLLFQAQRMMYAGICFPELKEADTWLNSGITKLNEQIEEQVYADGMHYEMDLGYHLAAIDIFYQALRVATLNDKASVFPQSYKDIIRKMITVTYNTNYPNDIAPLFSDGRQGSSAVMKRNYNGWLDLFPNDQELMYFASESRQEGAHPNYLSKAFKESGFYVFRNDWSKGVIQMVVKNTPKAGWHNQPDNGTFELWYQGQNLFPDSGAYSYGGDKAANQDRNWFRQTKVHNTLTLDGKNVNSQPKLVAWNAEGEGKTDYLVIENESYPNLKHRRTVYFVEKKFFVILDEAIGNAEGDVAIHYNFVEGETTSNEKNFYAATTFDNKNVALRCYAPEGTSMQKSVGKVSYEYNKYKERDAYAFSYKKQASESSVKFVTVIFPNKKAPAASRIVWLNQEDADAKEMHFKIFSAEYHIPYL